MTDEENNPNENPHPHESTAKFGLNEPTGQFQDLKDRLDREAELAGDGTGVYDDVRAPSESDSVKYKNCLLYTSPSPRDLSTSRMPSSA